MSSRKDEHRTWGVEKRASKNRHDINLTTHENPVWKLMLKKTSYFVYYTKKSLKKLEVEYE